MKKLVLLAAVFLTLIGCTQEKSNPIEGAWNLFYAKSVSNDTLVREFPTMYQGSDMKMWSKEHFIFVGRYNRDTVYQDSYGGGTYTLNGNLYEENIQYHTTTAAVGMKIKMLVEVNNDTLVQIFPVNDEGQIDNSNVRIEKYTRLK